MNNLEFVFILVFLIVFTINRPALSDLSLNRGSNGRIPEHSIASSRIRDHFKLVDLFDFSRFKTIFKKSYDSVLEEVVRRKLYLGRAFRVFISAVSYKYRISNSYLAINHMSDWTPTESISGYIRIPTRELQRNVDQDIPVVSLKDIRRKFSDIMRHKNKPGYHEIYTELKDGFKRKLTEFSGLSRDISLDYLMKTPRYEDINQIQGSDLIENNQNGSGKKLMGARESWMNDGLDEMRSLNRVNNRHYLDEIVEASVSNFRNPLRSGKRVDANNGPSNEIFIDHGRSNCFFRPRNQGKCGSCYAFTAMALYEYAFCRATGRRVAFSEQYIIDCGKVAGLYGCKCGWFSRIPNFVNSFGLELRFNYPYINREGVCPIPPGTPSGVAGSINVKSSGFVAYNLETVESVLRHTPMAMNVFVTKSFREYSGGVDDAIGCRDTNYLHAMVLIGTGFEDGKQYWLLRNSFSSGWGINGNYKLNRQSNHCIRNNIASALNVVFDFTRKKKRQNNAQRYQEYIPSDYEE